MNIRRAEEKDMDALEKLLKQVLTVHHTIRPDLFKPGAQKYTRSELKELIRDDARPIFVAEDESGVLGYCFTIFEQHTGSNILTDVKSLYIDDLCVDENARGKGVGSALYSYACDFAKASGCYNVTLNVWAGNDDAMKFYEGRGLTPQKVGMEHIL